MDNLEFEKKYLEKGYKLIAGIDEVGRGPLAGPVVCCAIIMPLDDLIDGVTDSKKLSAKRREKLDTIIREKAIDVSIYSVSEKDIDEINILQAVKKCMCGALNGLTCVPDITLIDGQDIGLPVNAEYIIKGDFKSYTISCASIVAKVFRDNLMVKYDKEYPDYDFKTNKGYGTKSHIETIKEIGPCKLHRKTFIKNFWDVSEKNVRKSF